METAELAYERARKLLWSRPGASILAVLLSVLDAALWIGLLVVAGGLADLWITRGVTHLRPDQAARAPAWLRARAPQPLAGDAWIPDTGLTRIVIENGGTDSPWLHRQLAGSLRTFLNRFQPLQRNRGALTTLLGSALVLLLALLLVYHARRRIAIHQAVEASSTLRRQVHRQMYRLGQSALPNQGVGPVLNLFTREVNDVRDALANDVDRKVRLPVLGIGLLLVALVISWPLSLFIGSLIGICALGAVPLIRTARRNADVAARDAAVQLCLLHEDLGLVRTVRVFGMEAVDKDRFDEHLSLYEAAEVRRMRAEGRAQPTLLFVVGAGITAAAAVIGYVVLGLGVSRLALAAVIAVGVALYGLAKTFVVLSEQRRTRRVAARSALAVFEYLDRRPELTMSVGARFLPPLKDRITFEHVSLRDPHGHSVLSGISAEIKAGTRCAIMGLDTAACEALVCLVPRLIDPTVGRVRVDGVDIKDVTLESLRAQVATVLQSDLIFSDSVLANIALGDPSFTLPRVIQAAKLAHAHNFVQNLPNGYDTVVGPLGHYLTPDEQYRIALARAYLHDPSILIIEEPTGPIDDEIKPLIDDTLDRLAQGRTLILLPGRLSTLRRCDQVILLENGEVESIGTPRQLMKDSKLYRHLQYVNFHKFQPGEVEAGATEG